MISLGLVCFGLAVLLAWLLLLPPNPIEAVPGSMARTNTGNAAVTAALAAKAGNYDEITKRPLFTPTRRPTRVPPVAAAPIVQAPKPLPSLILLGTIITETERIAFVRLPDRPHGQAVRVDDIVSDWKVTQIQAGTVVLESGTLKHAVQVEAGSGAVPPTRSAPPPPAIRSNQNKR